jgi:hypothetical protein
MSAPKYIVIGGENLRVGEAIQKYGAVGVTYNVYNQRIRRDWDRVEAITTSVDKSQIKNKIQKGMVFGYWTVIGTRATKDKITCKCVCKAEEDVNVYSLLKGSSLGCRTCRQVKLDVNKGDKYGRLSIIKEVDPAKSDSGRQVKCKCDCGNIIVVRLHSLRTEGTQSCGCLRKELDELRSKKSGLKHPLRSVWVFMLRRCYDTRDLAYASYGGRGIKICKEWRIKKDSIGFFNFVKWAEANGWSEGCGLTIDREDNNKGYSPSNCRWVDWTTQARNRRNNIWINYKGNSVLAIEAVEKFGVEGLSYPTFIRRLDRGWSITKALTKNIDTSKHRLT